MKKEDPSSRIRALTKEQRDFLAILTMKADLAMLENMDRVQKKFGLNAIKRMISQFGEKDETKNS